MFKFAETGIVTWPVQFPIDSDGNIVDTTVLVRFKVLTRAELRVIENSNVQAQVMKLADVLESVMKPNAGTTDAERAAEQQRKAEATLASIEAAQAVGNEREDARIYRLRTRIVAIQPPGEPEFVQIGQDEIDRQLTYQVLVVAYEKGLMDASRGAVAKN